MAVPVPVGPSLFRVEVRAFGGRDGRPLWSRSLPTRASQGGPLDPILPELTPGDLDGDGLDDLVVVDHIPRAGDGAIPWTSDPRDFEVLRLDGRSGEPMGKPWTFRDLRPGHERPARPVLADLDGRGHRVIALWTRDEAGSRITVRDAMGATLKEWNIEGVPPSPWPPSLFAVDLDGDGGDEIASILSGDTSTLRVFGGELKRPLWWREFPGLARIVEVTPGGSGRPATVVVGSLHNTVFGLDGATGRTLWRGQGREGDPGPTVNDVPVFDSPLLHDAHPGGTPRIVSRSNGSTVCLLTLSTTGDGVASDRAPAVVRPAPADPRLIRPLPWTLLDEEAFAIVLESAAMALVLVVLPILALSWVVGRRPWRLGRLLLVPVILGATMATAQAWKPDAPPLSPFLQAMAGLPIVVLAWKTGLWSIRRRWGRLGLLAMALVAVASALAVFQVWIEARAMAPWQHYSWDDWYWILVPAAYGAGLLLTLGLVVGSLARLARRGWRRVFGGPQPS